MIHDAANAHHAAPPHATRPIRIAQFGLGPIGVESLRLAAEQPWIEVVGGIDIDPAKVGRSLGEMTGLDRLAGARVHDSFEALWRQAPPDAVFHTAGSRAAAAIEQIAPIAERGVSVVTTCEEMLYPRLAAPEQAAALDSLCRRSGARVVATGVNPGFVLDLLPACLTGVCRRVDRVYGERVVDASTRREPLQRKIGSGMDPDAFRQRFREGKAGHAGFKESVALIAHALGWSLGPIGETCEPIVAERDIRTRYFDVPRGKTAGLHQRVTAEASHGAAIELDLTMRLDAPDPHDLVRIEGVPRIETILPGGVPGDDATVAALINTLPRLLRAPAGLRLLTDLPIPACAAGGR